MHINIADDLKKKFHCACAILLGMNQVITQLVEQWLKANKTNVMTQEKTLRGHNLS